MGLTLTPCMTVTIQVKVEHGPDDKGRERTSAQIPTESRRAGKEDGGVPQVELQFRKSSVQQPNNGWGQSANQKTEQDRTEVR